MRALYKNEELGVEEIKNAFSLKYGIEKNREVLKNSVNLQEENIKLRNLVNKFIKNMKNKLINMNGTNCRKFI